MEGDAVELLNDWACLARGQTPPAGEEPPSVVGRQLYLSRIGLTQVLSATAQRAAAAEILNRVREEVATRNAMHARGA